MKLVLRYYQILLLSPSLICVSCDMANTSPANPTGLQREVGGESSPDQVLEMCGDLRCEGVEDETSCPVDCRVSPPLTAGETVEGGEIVDGTNGGEMGGEGGGEVGGEVGGREVPAGGETSYACGDGVCDPSEDEVTCAEDCAEDPVTPPSPAPDPSRSVIGYVDSITQRDDAWLISGWACHPGWAPSVEVAIYAGGPEGEGQFIKRALADSEQEEAVGQACEVADGQHRYRIPFTEEELSDFAGERIYVHGISPLGADNPLLTHSGDFSLPGQTGGGPSNNGGVDELPVDLDQITWLHTDVSRWPITSSLTVSFQGGIICLDYDKANVWPSNSIPHNSGEYDIEVVGNPWVILNYGGSWYAATWEWLVVGGTCKNLTSVAGDHIKQFAHIPENWTPVSGERLFFMVSGLARSSNLMNVQERTNIVEVVWP